MRQKVAALGGAALRGLAGLEGAFRELHPPRIPVLREQLAPLRSTLDEAAAAFHEEPAPSDLEPLWQRFGEGAGHLARALESFVEEAPPAEAVPRILTSMRAHARAQESLYPLRLPLRPLSAYFAEPELRDRVDELEGEPADGVTVGIHRGGADPDARGGFTLYVPETYDGLARPLIVALHGGSGSGRDFLWTWLREARSRRALLLSPTARGQTWSFDDPGVDGENLDAMVRAVRDRWAVDPEKILLTGLSDGATFTLLWGLSRDSPCTALAPLSGVLHPFALSGDGRERAEGLRIYLVHGALDWMFPVQIARVARDELERAGAEVTYREIDDLSHTYAREENSRILDWLGAPIV